MKNYLHSLNEREKWMVISAAICLTIYCYYLFAYSPLSNKVKQRKAQFIEKTETLAWMQKVKHHQISSTTRQTVNTGQLLSLLAKQLKNNPGLKYAYQLQQTGLGDIQLTFEAVPFNLFMTWLAKLNERYTVIVKQFNAQQSDIPGITKLSIIISAPN